MIQLITFLIILPLAFVSNIFTDDPKGISAEEILQKTADKLASLKTVKYKYQQEYNYKSEAYFAESAAETFLDFNPTESAIGLVFQFENEKDFITYNGSETFSLNKKEKTIQVEPKPTSEKLSSSSYLQFALPMWRNVLPKIIADKSIVKAIRDAGMTTYIIEFALDKSFIESGLGTKIEPMTIDRKTIYRLTIDNKTFLPTEIYRGNNVNEDFNKVTISEIVENPTQPVAKSWYYSTYLNEYKYAKPPADNLIKTGEAAHEINLPIFGTEKTVSLNDYKDKIVLLEFWIFHCGACQASVPKLNALQEKYKRKNFQLLTINIADSEKQIQLFIDKLKPEFPILHQGEAIAKQYGVWFYPTIVLLGKDGKVIYSGQFDETKIEELINKNL
jgi:thiol-disulfide isomerase/thioredoxin